MLLAGIDSKVFGNDVLNLPIGDLAWCADSWLIQQAIQTRLSKAFPPLAHGRTGDVQFSGDLGVAHPLPTTENDPGTHCHRLSGLGSMRDGVQLLAILGGDFKRFLGATGAHSQVCDPIQIYAMYFSLRTLVPLVYLVPLVVSR